MRLRVIRGGTWNNNENNVRVSIRNNNNNGNNNIGFRCAQDSAKPALEGTPKGPSGWA